MGRGFFHSKNNVNVGRLTGTHWLNLGVGEMAMITEEITGSHYENFCTSFFFRFSDRVQKSIQIDRNLNGK